MQTQTHRGKYSSFLSWNFSNLILIVVSIVRFLNCFMPFLYNGFFHVTDWVGRTTQNMTFQDNLGWSQHIRGKSGTILALNQRLFVIRRLKGSLSQMALCKVADSIFNWCEDFLTSNVWKRSAPLLLAPFSSFQWLGTIEIDFYVGNQRQYYWGLLKQPLPEIWQNTN